MAASGASSVALSVRELQLQREVAALRAQLQHAQARLHQAAAAPPSVTAAATTPRWSSHSAAETVLIDLLADIHASASDVERCLHSFPAAGGTAAYSAPFARSCYDTLLDDVSSSNSLHVVLAKLVVLRRHRLYCPSAVWRQQRKMESIALACSELEQDEVGQLLAGVFRCLVPGAAPAVDDLYTKLDGADLLLVLRVLAQRSVLSVPVRRQKLLGVVHFARHGPLQSLQAELAELSAEDQLSLCNSAHNGLPLLFQPLINDPSAGWLDRLRVLLQAGARADVVYAPWNCSALHMLVYRKSAAVVDKAAARVRNESRLVEAVQLLLQHGANMVLNLVDEGGQGGRVKLLQRTALMQAASGGHFQVCERLLAAGAAADPLDSSHQSVLDILFYLKHSHLQRHQAASAGYSCMDLYGMVNRHGLAALLTDELREDCNGCGTCRYLLASVGPLEEGELEGDEEEEDENERESESVSSSSNRTHGLEQSDTAMTGTGARARMRPRAADVTSLEKLMHRMRLQQQRPRL